MNVLILLISLSHSYFLSTEWELKRDRNNIKVYLREKNSFTQEYLAETIIESDLKSIYEIIIDYDNSHEWMYKLESSRVIKKETENLLYVYFTVNMNWPLKKRDLVSDVKITQGEDNITIDLNSVPDYIARDIIQNFRDANHTEINSIDVKTKNDQIVRFVILLPQASQFILSYI